MNKVKETDFITRVFKTPSKDYSEWFGYYNYDTLNENQTKILCARTPLDGVRPEKGMQVELGYYNIATKTWNHIGYSDSWNWQQGAMLQWLPTANGDECVIYNSSKDNHLISRIVNIDTGLVKDIDWPIYGITPDGKHSIALEMHRSYWCRAYHYASVANKEYDGSVYESDGIFEIDLLNNTRKRIIPIQDIIAIDSKDNFSECKHWLEHIMINPAGTKFCFLHRYSPVDNVYSYQTRLFIADIDGSNLRIVPGWQDYQWSHFGWKDNDDFVIYTVKKGRWQNVKGFRELFHSRPFSLYEVVKKFIVGISTRLPYEIERSILKTRRLYQVYNLDKCNNAVLIDTIESGLFDIDGHPSFTEDGRYMITDSYPDKKGYQRLIVYDTITHKGLIIARLYAYYKGNPASCDLHPKLSKNNNYLAVDSAYDERHHLLLFKLDWEKIKNKISNGTGE